MLTPADVPGLPEAIPAPSVLPQGAKILVHALARESSGTLVPCGSLGADGGVRSTGGLTLVEGTKADDFDPRATGTQLITKLPPADVYLVVAVGPGERLHGEYATPNAKVGDIVALAANVKPQTNALTGPFQGLVFDHEITCRLPLRHGEGELEHAMDRIGDMIAGTA